MAFLINQILKCIKDYFIRNEILTDLIVDNYNHTGMSSKALIIFSDKFNAVCSFIIKYLS
jgi:hypothetical protein